MLDNDLEKKLRHFLLRGLAIVEVLALTITGLATTYAIVAEILLMVTNRSVSLADLLLMFLYLEVLAMIGQYLKTGQIQVRFPLYIAIVALARYLIIDAKALEYTSLIAVSVAIVVLALAVLIIRYGHVRFPYQQGTDHLRKPAEPPRNLDQ